jgi:hypothetical protein
MKQNVGSVDRILRLVLGLGLVGWGYSSGNPWFYLGAIPLFTALIGWCPAYLPFGLSTAKSE